MSTVHTYSTILASLAVCVSLAACSNSKSDKKSGDDTAPPMEQPVKQPTDKPGTGDKPGTTPTEPPTTPATPDASRPETKPMGAEKVSQFNYEYGSGKSLYKKKVQPALKKKDWAAVKTGCEEVIAKDPWHLQAHHDLAAALVQLDQASDAIEHLDIALAGDWLRWGPRLEQHPNLKPIWSTESGDKLKALSAAYGDEFLQRVKTGVWMLGQRTRFKRPSKIGSQWSATRGELFAYDVETKRFLRITHTRERLAGWLRSPSGDEIAWIGYWQVIVPDPADSGDAAGAGEAGDAAGDTGGDPAEAGGDGAGDGAGDAAAEPAPIIFSRTIVGVLDGATLVPIGKQGVLRAEVARVDLQYRIGDELIISGFAADSEWRDRAAEPTQRYTYDKEAGKLKKISAEPSDQPVLSMTHERIWTTGNDSAGFSVSEGEGGSTLQLDGVEQGIALPANTKVAGVSRSPDKAFALVRTVAQPCGDPPSGSLYVVDAATGKLSHLLRGNSKFHVSWIDDRRFAYEDDNGRVRLHDLVEGKQIERLKNGGWLMLSGLSATRGIDCQL